MMSSINNHHNGHVCAHCACPTHSSCSLRSHCPVLLHARPHTLVLPVFPFADRKARHPISVPCASALRKVVYLCESPYDITLDPPLLNASGSNGSTTQLFKTDSDTAKIPSQVFIFKPKTFGYGTKYWGPAVSNACTREAIICNLARLCVESQAEKGVYLVGTEYIKSDMIPLTRDRRADSWFCTPAIETAGPVDNKAGNAEGANAAQVIIMRYHRSAVLSKVKEMMIEAGEEDQIEAKLDKINFVSLKSWVEEELDEQGMGISRAEAVGWL